MIHYLCLIYLYKPNYSRLLAIYWPKILYRLDDSNLLNEGTYSTRPFQSATNPPLKKEFMLEITCPKRKQ